MSWSANEKCVLLECLPILRICCTQLYDLHVVVDGEEKVIHTLLIAQVSKAVKLSRCFTLETLCMIDVFVQVR